MANATLLAGQRALPKALAASGFEFAEPTLEGALRAELRDTMVNVNGER
jgi:NAD dependent epimerase/dehydratase family enzyme